MIKEILNNLKSYFEISNFERRGAYSLLFILAIFACFFWYKNNYIYPSSSKTPSSQELAFALQVNNSFGQKQDRRNYAYTKESKAQPKLANFNPNTDTYEDLVQSGVKTSVAKNIINFRAKGGYFKNVEAIAKLYTVTDDYFDEIKAYIRINNDEISPKIGDDKPSMVKEKTTQVAKVVDLNSANEEDLVRLKGIGVFYAKKILRDIAWKGGYFTVNQLYEIKDLPRETVDAIVPFVKVDIAKLQKIKLNSADFAALRKHPYLSYKEVQAIINYREQHGNFTNFDDLKKIHLLKGKDFIQVLPYLDLN